MRNNAKNREIEQLRAVSICFVVFGHSFILSPFVAERIMPLIPYLGFGVGVDLFFCISGFVVARAYCDYFDRYRDSRQFWLATRMFWLRRIYRLLPSAWLWVVVGLTLAIFFNSTGVFMGVEQNLKSAVAIASFTANFAGFYGNWLAPNDVYWSLSLEEQFYFCFPLFLLLITGRRARIVVLLLVVAVQFPLERNIFGGEAVPTFLAMFRVDGFAWGILVFLFSRSTWYLRLEPRYLQRKPVAFAATVLLLYLLLAVFAKFTVWSISLGLVAFISAVLVWLASYSNGYLFGFQGVSLGMQWLGARSYGIYLIHMPVFRFTHEASTRYLQASGESSTAADVPFLLLFAGVLIVALAELNFRYVEEPLRRMGAARAKRKLAALEEGYHLRNEPSHAQ